MQANTRNRTLALAALFQCIDGVNQLSSDGQIDAELFSGAVNSLLSEDDGALEDLYGGVGGLRTGLRSLMYQLGSGNNTVEGEGKNMETTRYAINLLYLEKKLSNNSSVMNQLFSGITDAQQQLEHFEPTHTNIVARLADLYTNTISKAGPRIIIKGDQTHLSNPDNAAKIRVLLMAGIRAALLWRQAGGDRWKLLFSRGTMQKEARRLLQQG